MRVASGRRYQENHRNVRAADWDDSQRGTGEVDEEARAQLHFLIEGLSTEDRLMIAKLPRGDVISLHHRLGTVIRNQVRAGELGALFRWSKAQIGDQKLSLDALSWPILLQIWETVRSSSPDRSYGAS
jgi:hypothetical protein